MIANINRMEKYDESVHLKISIKFNEVAISYATIDHFDLLKLTIIDSDAGEHVEFILFLFSRH